MQRYLDLLACRVDLAARLARWPDGDRTLTPTETRLLTYLVEQEGRAVPRQELLKEVWGYRGGVVTRTVKTTVGRLRNKIERSPGEPEHLHTAVGVGYRFELAPPEAVQQAREASIADLLAPAVEEPTRVDTRTNLPPPTRPLVGRTDALEALEAARAPLVTVTGPAGVGKSALLHAWASARLGDGTWDEIVWCDLATASSADDVRRAVASALGMERTTDEPVDRWITRGLRARGRLLLLLDTVERSVNAAASELEGWLAGCPDLQVVAGSREALRLAQEAVLPLAPLGDDTAAALFQQRLPGDALPGYRDHDACAPVLARLDGLPLALEMAAAWTSLLSPDQLAERLTRQLDLLAGDRRDRPERHTSLRAAVGSSWELLDEPQRRGLLQLATFAGAFRASDAEAVVRGGPPPLLLLRDLVARSLLASPPERGADGEARLVLFAAVRDFAREQGVPDDAQARHTAWFARWGAPDTAQRLRRQGGVSVVALDADRDDLVAAGDRAIRQRDSEATGAVARALGALAALRGPDRADAELLDEALDVVASAAEVHLLRAELLDARGLSGDALRALDLAQGGSAEVTADALRLRALLLLRTTPSEARAAADAAVEAAQGDPNRAARAVVVQGWVNHELGSDDRAAQSVEAVLPELEAAGDARGRAEALTWLARMHRDKGRPLRASSLLQAALEVYRRVGDRRAEAALVLATAEAQAEQEELAGAQASFEEAESLLTRLGDRLGAARARLGLGRLAPRPEVAHAHFRAALHAARETRDRRCEAQALEARGALALRLGHHDQATTALLAASGLARDAGLAREEGAALGGLGRLRATEGDLEEARRCFERGSELLGPAAWRTDRVRLLEDWAQVEADAGDEAAAARLLNLAEDVAQLSLVDGPALL